MEMRCARLSGHRTNLFGYVEFHTAPKDDASAADDAGKEKALEPLGSKAFPVLPELVGATGFEPATPRPPV